MWFEIEVELVQMICDVCSLLFLVGGGMWLYFGEGGVVWLDLCGFSGIMFYEFVVLIVVVWVGMLLVEL